MRSRVQDGASRPHETRQVPQVPAPRAARRADVHGGRRGLLQLDVRPADVVDVRHHLLPRGVHGDPDVPVPRSRPSGSRNSSSTFASSIPGLFFVGGVVRVFVFAVVWIVFGRHFWVLPNITSDEIPIDEVFSPMWAFDDLDANGNVVGKISAINRLAAAGSAADARARCTRSRRRRKRHQVHQPRARLDTGPVRPVRHPPRARGGGGERDGRGQRERRRGGAKKPAGNETDGAAAGGETATAAGADDGHRRRTSTRSKRTSRPPRHRRPYVAGRKPRRTEARPTRRPKLSCRACVCFVWSERREIKKVRHIP